MRGEFEHVIDEKGRMFIPSKFRAELGCKFVLSKNTSGCLVAYPVEEWEAFEAKLKSFPPSKARPLIRFYVGSAYDVELDTQGRVLIPQKLREFAGLGKNVVIYGFVDHLEIWDADVRGAGEDMDKLLALEDAFGM